MRNCQDCGEPIPECRIKALPNCILCIKCTTEEKVVGIQIVSGKSDHAAIQAVSRTMGESISKMHRDRYYKDNGGTAHKTFKNECIFTPLVQNPDLISPNRQPI